MTRPLVLLIDPIGGDPGLIRRIVEEGGAYLEYSDKGHWQDYVSQADAVIVDSQTLNPKTISAMSRCRVISVLGIGVDAVDVASATGHGIWVTNVPDYCTAEVAEHALALILALLRRLMIAHCDVNEGRWNQLAYPGIRTIGATCLGILGLGRLGRALADRARALGFMVVAHDPAIGTGKKIDGVAIETLENVLANADIVSLHMPLTPNTSNLLDKRRLASMKDGAFLVNTSRGGIVDEEALIEHLDQGHLAGAALDAFRHEPLPNSSKLCARANVILTPHIAFYSEESVVSVQQRAAEEVLRVLSGSRPRNPVNEVIQK